MVRSLFMGLVRWATRLIGYALFLARVIIPILIWMIIRGMWASLITAVALCSGLPEHCRSLAEKWTKQAIEERGLTTNIEEHVRNFFEVVAWLMTFVGWVILSHITVWVWRIIW